MNMRNLSPIRHSEELQPHSMEIQLIYLFLSFVCAHVCVCVTVIFGMI